MNRYELPKETIIYGGAFNPPTRAHHAILQACVDYAEPRDADVWIMPSGSRSDKTIEISRDQRLAYIDALANDVVRRTVQIAVETAELDREIATETYDTVMEMNERYPDRRFMWVFGSDSVNTMHEWKGGETMLRELPMLVVERPGVPLAQLGNKAIILDVVTDQISSTLVRMRLEQHEAIDDLVTPSVRHCLVGA